MGREDEEKRQKRDIFGFLYVIQNVVDEKKNTSADLAFTFCFVKSTNFYVDICILSKHLTPCLFEEKCYCILIGPIFNILIIKIF